MTDKNSGRSHVRMVCISAAMMALIVILIFPVGHTLREHWEWLRCANRLRQIAFALLSYEQENGFLPPAFLADEAGKPLHSWRVLLLPYLGRDDLYRQIRLDEPWNSLHNRRFAAETPPVYRCLADTGEEGNTSYLAVTGCETLWPGSTPSQIPSHDRSDATLLIVEVMQSGISWMEPHDLPFEAARLFETETGNCIKCPHFCGGNESEFEGVYNSYNPRVLGHRVRGANCLFSDGSVCTICAAVSAKTMRALLTVNGETISRLDDGTVGSTIEYTLDTKRKE